MSLSVWNRITRLGGLILAFAFPCLIFSQNYLFDIQSFGTEDGLPMRLIGNMGQDDQGYIWHSSQVGIHRYDGEHFRTWLYSEMEMQAPMLAYFAFDHENRLWYSSRANTTALDSSGIIDLETGRVLSVKEISEGRFGLKDIEFVANPEPGSREIIIAMHSGIHYRYDGTFEKLISLEGRLWMAQVCRSAAAGGYWIINDSKLLRIDQGMIQEEYAIPMAPHKRVAAIGITDGTPWVEISGKMNERYFILKNGRMEPYAPPGTSPGTLNKLILDHSDFVVFASMDSLLIKDRNGELLLGIPRVDLWDDEGGQVFIRSFRDLQGNIWVGSTVGLLKISVRKNFFTVKFPGQGILGFLEQDDEIWYRFPNPDTVINPLPGGIPSDLLSFYEDDEGRIWAGTVLPYLLMYEPRKRSLTYIPIPDDQWSEFVFQNPATGHLWVTTNRGVYILEPGEGGVESYHMGDTILSSPEHSIVVRDFHINSEGIWVVSKQGLYLIDPETEKPIRHYTLADGLPTTNLGYLHEDEAGIFWLASNDAGLIRWDRGRNQFRQFTKEDGLSSNVLFAVFEDEYNTLWMPSNHGLVAFEKASMTARVYLSQDGIASNRFQPTSCLQAEDGTIYLGGGQGLTSFHPRDLQPSVSAYQPPLRLSGLQVLEKGKEDFTDLTAKFLQEKELALAATDRILKVRVNLLDYENSAENQYAYKLSGKEDEWIYTWDNEFSLINLPYGRYDLQVKGKGASGTWAKDILAIPIHVRKPVYLQTWFILCIALLALGILILVIRLRIRSLKKQQAHLEVEVEKRTEEIEADRKVIETQKRQLQQLDAAKSRFFTNITHEFRTPLTLVIGPVEQELEEEKELPARTRTKLKGVLKNARNLLGLINQLLDISKLESGSMNLEVARGEIVSYTRNLVAQFNPLAEQKQIALSFSTPMADWETYWDAEKWEKTVFNLLSNAIKFTAAGGKVMVSLERVREGDRELIVLGVKDTGLGIAPDQLDRIFNRFYQVQSSSTRVQGGTGVGLALVKELVEFQQGKIQVQSVAGEGTLFTVQLPVYPMASPLLTGNEQPSGPEVGDATISEPEVGLAEPISSHHTPSSGDRLQLLIIEDDSELRTFIRSCLDPAVYEVTEAADGAAGLQMALEMVPDLIISDVMMPNMDGFEVTKAIREHLATSHIPLILLTAKAALESRLEGLRRGADAYLTKPFSPRELAIRIENLIELRKKLQDRYGKMPGKGEPAVADETDSQIAQVEDQFMSELMAYLAANLQEGKLAPAEIAQHFALSRSQLYRKVQSLTDKTIGDLLRELRCEKALLLIRENQLTLSEVAYEVGFSSPSYFSRAFKKHFGKAPSEVAGSV